MWKLLASVAFGAFKLIGGGAGLTAFAEKGLQAYVAAKNVDLEKFKASTSAEKETLLGMLASDDTRVAVQRDLVLAAMSHPIWWIAWGMFVFPVGIYHATIYLLSTLGIGPEIYAVLRVPHEQEQWGRDIVKTIFVAQAGTGVAGGLIQSIERIFKRK
jgi:hypothetical protein